MPDFHIPQTKTWVSWPDHHTGVIRIKAFLPIYATTPVQTGIISKPLTGKLVARSLKTGSIDTKPPCPINAGYFYIPIEVSFRREHLERLFKAALYIETFSKIVFDIDSALEKDDPDLRSVNDIREFWRQVRHHDAIT